MKTKIGVLISGGGTNLQSLIDNTKNEYISGEIAVVISNRKSAFGLQRAKDNNIPAVFISKKEAGSADEFNQQIIKTLEENKVDLVVLAGYLSILPPEFINKYPNKIINIHPALIPSFCGDGYYGEKVHQAVIDYGAKISGATVHFVDKGTDTGAIILQKSVKVENDDTAETLQKKVLKIEHEILPLAVKLYCEGKIKPIQKENKRTIVKLLR